MKYELMLRDAFVDLSLGNTDMRIGNQQIVWGEAIGTFVADVVNPRDLREFILPDFEFIRIPQWAVTVEQNHGDLHAELIWIPILEFNKFGLPGSEFAPAVPISAGTPILLREEQKPATKLKNGDFGGRVSYLYDGWDFAVFHFYGWDRSPAINRTISPFGVVTLSPYHERLPITGATLSKEFSEYVLRAESAFSHNKRFSVLDVTNRTGLVAKDVLETLVGVSHTFFTKLDVNVQFIHKTIMNYGPTPIFQERAHSPSGSLWLKTGFLNNHFEPEFLILSTLDRKDLMMRPRVNITLSPSWQIRTGIDLFEGGATDRFGQYRNRNRVYAELKYKF
jgi:hypothetical protein